MIDILVGQTLENKSYNISLKITEFTCEQKGDKMVCRISGDGRYDGISLLDNEVELLKRGEVVGGWQIKGAQKR